MIKASWSRLSIVAAVLALGAGAGGIAACTVTSTPNTTDAGTFDSGNPDTGFDAGVDTGTTGPITCATSCPILGTGNGQFNQDTAPDATTCGACDNCTAASCCTEFTNCFTPTADGGDNECKQLNECLAQAQGVDGGTEGCYAAHSDASATAYDALNNCNQTKCTNPCK